MKKFLKLNLTEQKYGRNYMGLIRKLTVTQRGMKKTAASNGAMENGEAMEVLRFVFINHSNRCSSTFRETVSCNGKETYSS